MSRSLNASDASDSELMRRAQDNDVDAFEHLYDRHVVSALRVASSVLRNRNRAEDAVQDGFLAIWRDRAKYRPDAGSFRDWSLGIIRYRAIDAVRRDAAWHRPESREAEALRGRPPGRSPQDAVIARDESDALRASLAELPEAQAEVIALAFYGELTHTEIAERLALPAGTVKGRMRLGLRKLRDQMPDSR